MILDAARRYLNSVDISGKDLDVTLQIFVNSSNWYRVIVGSVVNRTTVGGQCKLLHCEVNTDLKPEDNRNAIY